MGTGPRVLGAMALALLVSGCGGAGSGTPASPTERATSAASSSAESSGAVPTATAGPASSSVVQWARAVAPNLISALERSRDLVAGMQSDALADAARDCVATAQVIVGLYSAFQGISAPPDARPAWKRANDGYRLVLSAADECGMASDSRSARHLLTAISDAGSGIRKLTSARSQAKKWAGSR